METASGAYLTPERSPRLSTPRTAPPRADRPVVRVSVARLGYVSDRVCLRDPRGKSCRPSIVPLAHGDLEIRGDFTILQSFSISPAAGKAFVESSRDSNPIHVEGTIVPGAMTAARFLLLPEILISGLAVRSLRVKFRAFAHYSRPFVNVYRVYLDAEGTLAVQLSSYQRGVLVADGTLSGSLGNVAPLDATAPRATASPSAEIIRTFLRSIAVDPDGCFASLGFGYPRAFLAALPPGEMVRMGGAGGLLNILDLEFPETLPPITHEPPPTAEVEETRPRNSFRRVIAKVGNGIKTYCRGYATVLANMVLGKKPAPGVSPSS